jgi:hypothetical protein
MFEYAISQGLTADGNWHEIDVSNPVNTYDKLNDGTDVPSIPGFFIGGLYSLRARGTYEAKINPDGTASFRSVRMGWLATDVTNAHSYGEARATGSSILSAVIEAAFGYYLGDGLLGADFDLFIYFDDGADASAVPASHRWNY